MICQPCATAADQQLGRDAHCDDPKCMCGHRVERYRAPSGFALPTGFFSQLTPINGPALARLLPASTTDTTTED